MTKSKSMVEFIMSSDTSLSQCTDVDITPIVRNFIVSIEMICDRPHGWINRKNHSVEKKRTVRARM